MLPLELLGALRPDLGLAFVLIQHLSPTHVSSLAQILGRATQMPVVQVEGKTKLEADHVYVIPPDRELHVVDHELSATNFTEPRGHRSPINGWTS